MKEKGFTLTEMMIAIVLGMVLITGALNVYMSTKQGYRMGQGMTLMQATGRATLDFLSHELSMAGFPQVSAIESFIPAMTTDGGGNNSDVVAVRYRTVTNCFGTATPVYADGVQYAKNMYFIQDEALFCRTLAEDDSTLAEVMIIPGVENIQLLYGEDTDATDSATNATKYVSAGNVVNWNNVVSVKLGVLVNSQKDMATTNDGVAYDLQGQTQIAAANDHMRRRAYSATVVVRNRMQGS
jgi:type IV pilus assembly protein PilW